MKMLPEHLQTLRDAIALIPASEVLEHQRNLRNDPRVKDQAKRMRWDLLYGAMRSNLPRGWISNELYTYLDDSHIDTALKSICNELGY